MSREERKEGGQRLLVQCGQRAWRAPGAQEDRASQGGPGFWMEARTEARRRAGTGAMLLSLELMGQALVPLWGNRSDLEGGKAAGRWAEWPERPRCNAQCCTRLSAAFHLGLLGGRLTIDLCPKNETAGPGTLTGCCALIAYRGAGAAAVHGGRLGGRRTRATACIVHSLICLGIH